MISGNELTNRILAGASRRALRQEGFRFSNAAFGAIQRGGRLRARDVSDAAMIGRRAAVKTAGQTGRPLIGLKSNRVPTGNMLLADPNVGKTFPFHKYIYRAKIVTIDPGLGEVEIMGRFSDDRLLTGKEIRQRMQGIGEQSLQEQVQTGSGMATPQGRVQFGGRVKRIDILTTLFRP